MPQLSIVIPAFGSSDALEATLVSVLQNRPHDCEIVVVLDRVYDDPYELSDEVRFLVVREARCVADALAAALPACRGGIVHLLAAGAEVDEGWTDAALEHFCDARIAAVAPLIIAQRETEQVYAAGLEYGLGGRRKLVGHGSSAAAVVRTTTDVLGPTSIAAFYRRDAVAGLVRPFDAVVGDALVDADLALQLRQAGYRAVLEPRSLVYQQSAATPEADSFSAGRAAERLFWRNIAYHGALPSAAVHPFTMLGELFTARTFGEKCLRLLGRLVAWFEIPAYLRHRREVASIGRPGLAFAVVSTGDRIRIDAAHPHPAAAGKPKIAAERRLDGESGRAA